MANGCCRYHGGKTPKGSNWHKPSWPSDGPAFEAKLNGKLKRQEQARKRKASRLALMDGEELQRHQDWQRSHKPGSVAMRRQAKRERQYAETFQASLTDDTPINRDPELVALEAKIKQAEAQWDIFLGVGIFG